MFIKHVCEYLHFFVVKNSVLNLGKWVWIHITNMFIFFFLTEEFLNFHIQRMECEKVTRFIVYYYYWIISGYSRFILKLTLSNPHKVITEIAFLCNLTYKCIYRFKSLAPTKPYCCSPPLIKVWIIILDRTLDPFPSERRAFQILHFIVVRTVVELVIPNIHNYTCCHAS